MVPPQDPVKVGSTSDEVGSSSRAINESASSIKRKSLSPKGVRFGEAVETIGSKYGVGLPLAIRAIENPRTSENTRHHKPYQDSILLPSYGCNQLCILKLVQIECDGFLPTTSVNSPSINIYPKHDGFHETSPKLEVTRGLVPEINNYEVSWKLEFSHIYKDIFSDTDRFSDSGTVQASSNVLQVGVNSEEIDCSIQNKA
ncbi:hypothetical protein Tco_1019236 [Tanacetum coccineum]|uniref:Uncharacterized protein n=1 Tax=Tanacetum coccineum TaxID=301880 RepID=A0ABQ5FWI6_9ASTR